MIELFLGHDPREEVGTWTFCSSVIARASVPVQFTPLHKPALETAFGKRFAQGTNAFTVSRFLIPALRDWRFGTVIFADGADMVCKADIAELASLVDHTKAVQVVKHQYKSRHPRKYVGTKMEAENREYKFKNHASLMLLNCGNYAWRKLTPDKIADMPVLDLLQFKFLEDDQIGELPLEWNWLADEYGENEHAKLLHWTAGVPGFENYRNSPHAADWFAAKERMNYATD